MADKTPQQVILDKINETPFWITKGTIYDWAEMEGISPETGARYARILAEERKILVSYYKSKKGKDLARYARLGETEPLPKKPKVEIVVGENGQLLARIIE